MFKEIILAVCVALAVLGAPPPKQAEPAKILSYENSNDGLGNYTYSYQTSNGIQHSEQSDLANPGTEKEAYSVRGSFSFVAPDGVTYSIQYVADANGFQPSGKHLPVGP